ncbi:insulinase family protein [Ramlibacter sp. XY19]|uniref:M16 family metallopeptidase n=1 Tax=Ramlibacter paludis TaxID=2908000 RepID=UPI0023D9D1CA|nr:M16 family metallopeptidase [Ramlibacter paludis]MCG2594460.1 insulinase family protein [Ramlibacter paludis]
MHCTSRFILAAAAFAVAAAAHAQLKPVREVEGVSEYALPNGLTVLVHADQSKPTTTVNLVYRVGSKHEGNGETGAAHLLEHLLFKATDSVADPKEEMTRRGARWNGTTSWERTNYFAQFSSDAETLDWMLRWLAESMTKARLEKRDLDSEMTVVRNELERAENDPSRILGARMRAAAFHWHGYGRDVLGARSDVENVPIEKLRAFYRTWYRPDNAVLVIGGRFDEKAALQKVEQVFGAIARPATPLPAAYTREPVQDGERQVVLRRVGGTPQVAVLYHVMPGADRDFAAALVLAQLLSRSRGPLDKALVDTKLAASRWAWATGGVDPGFLMAGAVLGDTATPEPAARAAQDVLLKTIETLAPDAREVAEARSELLQSVQAQLRDPEQLSLALTGSVAAGDWRLLFAHRDWIEAVTPEDVKRVAAAWMLPSNRTVGFYLPDAALPARAPAPALVAAAEVLRDYRGRTVTAAAEDFPLTPEAIEPRIVKARLEVGGAPGLHLAVLPRQTKESRVTGTMRLRWGTADTVKGSSVLATFLGPMMLQANDQVRTDLLALDATLRINSGAGGMTANFELPARNVQPFFQLLARVLRPQDFPEAAFERIRAAALAANKGSQSDPGALASTSLQRVFSTYPEGDPREARTLQRTADLLQAATPAQLRAFWQRFGGAGLGEIAVVGPVDPQAVRAALQQAFGDWRSAEPRQPWIFEYPAQVKDRWQQVMVPDKANATYTARIPLAMTEESPDFPALSAAVQLLGGRPGGTALWKRVREQEGLSYGVGSSLFVPASARAEGTAAAININASFAPQNRDRLREVIRDELQQRAKNGFSALEVSFARRAIVSARADWLAQPANLAGLLASNLRWDRDMAWYGRMTEAYEKLDTQAVNSALARYLDVERLTEVAAGTFP